MKFKVPPREKGPKTHLPVALVIDTSASTEDIRELLNQCSCQLIRSLKRELTFQRIVELLVIFFNSDYQDVLYFKPLEMVDEHELDIVESKGFTATGRALIHALDCIDRKKMEWKQKGEKYYQPLLFLLTDGYPDAGVGAPSKVVEKIEEWYALAAQQIKGKEEKDKIVFIAAGIQQKNGCNANMEKLKELSSHPERILRVTDQAGSMNSIEKFYQLIYESTNATFANTPVDDVIGQTWLF